MRVLDIKKVLVISDNGDRVRGALEIMLPFGEGEDDSKEFSVINIVVVLSEGEDSREVGTGMGVTVGIFLHKNCSSSEERCISYEEEEFRDIRNGENWGRGEDLS